MPQVTNQEIAMAFLAEKPGELLWVDEWSLLAKKATPANHYLPYLEDTLQHHIAHFMVKEYANVGIGMSKLRDIASLVKIFCTARVELAPSRYIAFSDCYLDAHTFTTIPIEEEGREPIYAIFGSPYSFDEIQGLPMPVFDNYLKTTFVKQGTKIGDPSIIPVLQEMMGNLLLPSMEACSAFFLTGDGHNGKSKLLEVCKNIIGKQYCSATSLESLTTNNFRTAGLIGKRLNICSEEESKHLRVDKFKGIVQGDMTTAEYKFGKSFEFMPTTKFIFASNNIPSFDGIDKGVLRRIKIIPFYREFTYEDRDTELPEKLLAETPAILWWAIQGAKRLKENGYIFSIGSSDALLRELDVFKSNNSAVVRFMEYKNYQESSTSFTSNDTMYEHYKDWCLKWGQKSMNSNNFFKDVVRILPDAKVITARENGEVKRGRRIKITPLTVEGEAQQELINVEDIKF